MLTPHRTTHALVAIILLAALTLAPQADVRAVAITRYVSSVGEDSTNCSDSAAPCLTINYAIGQAGAGDTIDVTVGTYTAAAGAEVVLVNKNLTLSGGWDFGFTSQGDLSTIDGENARRGITVNEGFIAAVDHFAVQNGFHASQGGGIYNNHATLTLTHSQVSQNLSEWMGGGIDSFGTLTINESTISDNTAGKVGYSGGGGGGGIEVYSGTATINNTTLSGNKIVGAFSGSAIDGGTVILNNSTVSGGSGAEALSGFVDNLTLNNSTVSGNTAPSGTAGIDIAGGSLTLNNSTVTGNTTPSGVGGILNESGYGGAVILRNSIVAGNTGTSGTQRDCYGTITSAGYNLLGSNSSCTFTASTGDLVGTAGTPINPRLDTLKDNGGPTKTHALLGDSPAVNAGNPAIPGSGGDACLATDQRGFDRVAEGDCDIGSFEGHFPIVTGITRTDPNPTGASSVHFSVAFSNPVTGVDLVSPFSDFSLTKTGLTGATVTAVGGSGSTYNVTVNTGSGDGTLRLNVVDDDSIVEEGGLPLGGTGAGNGDYSSGEAYTVDKTPTVKSIVRAATSPTSATQVKFYVGLSTAVIGVDQLAPFSDFKLTTTGVMGASISAVSGSATVYTVTVKTGSGNGTIRLDVKDDDSIQDMWGNPLGGVGAGNGNFTTGQTYVIKKIPNLTTPKGTLWDTTPTYNWTKVAGATQYRYQLIKGTTTIYTKTVLASVCGTTCADTPLTVLTAANYKWRARALASGIWQAWSPYLGFKLVAPKAGLWTATYGQFYVTPSRARVDDFATRLYIPDCGTFTITRTVTVPINNGKFAFTGSYNATGQFSAASADSISAQGTVGFNSYYIAGCGLVSAGPASWTATWTNSSQPAAATGMSIGPIVVAPAPEGEGLPLPAEAK